MKKKQIRGSSGALAFLPKILRTMKLIFLFMFAALLQVSASSYSQNTKLNLSGQNLSLEEVFDRIEQQSEFSFIYNLSQIDLSQKVNVDFKGERVETILDELLLGTRIAYTVNNRLIIVHKAGREEAQNSITVQQKTVSGKVTDENGEPLPGVTVVISGTTQGTVTDINGEYSLINFPENAILQFSFVGMKTQEVTVAGKTDIDVVMTEESIGLEEVVAIGYGSVKKRDLVGAVEHISGEIMEKRSNMNVTRSLQGMVPGLNITVSDGKPSRGPRNLNIRGTGSIGAGGSALILIDGVEAHGDLTTVNPSDIESMTVLKDASSAAIYGAKGAFGVILITTKNPQKGEIKVNYNGKVSVHERMYKYEDNIVTNGLQWTDRWYSGYLGGIGTAPGGINNAFKYTTDWYNELVKRDADPTLSKVRVNDLGEYEYFGNTNWFDIIYKDFNLSTEHNISVSGGSDIAKYYVSGRYFKQDGIYTAGDEEYEQYNFRGKGSVVLSDKLTLNNNTDMIRRFIHQPKVNFNELLLRQMEHQGYPVTLPKNPDGTWTEAGVYTGWASYDEGTTYQENKKFDFKNTTTLTYKPLDVLTLKADFSYYFNQSGQVRVEDMYDFYVGPSIMKSREIYTSLDNWSFNNEYVSSNVTANYIPKFKNEDHKLNTLVGWNIEKYKKTNVRTYRRGLVYPEKPSFALMDGDYFITDQTGYSWAYVGFLYRANYSYKDRYLIEISGRYDGSSKFPKNQQWGFFPSTSLGWRISDENFMEGASSWLDNLKARFSIGSLGNGNVSPYQFLSTIDMNRTSDIIGDGLQVYADAPRNIPSGLTWEKSTTYDVGVDLDMFQNRLSFIFDYYKRYTSDMFTVGTQVPAVFGDDVPKGNNADLTTNGVELSLQWRSSFNLASSPFNYSIKGVFWDNKSKITKYNNPTNSLSTYYEGQVLGEIWGYHVEGLFKDQAEIDAHADQSAIRVSSPNILMPGDLKFADLNDDGTVNSGSNTLENPGDRRIIGNTTPRYNFGFYLSGNWKGIGLSAFIQGIGKRDWYPNAESGLFWGQYNRPYGWMLKEHVDDNIWTEENQNVDAYWPRHRSYLATNMGKTMTTVNDRYLQSVAFVRFKSLRLDYTFKNQLCQKLRLSGLQIYVEGDNLFTWSPLYKHSDNMDPEMIYPGDSDFGKTDVGTNGDGDGYGYPMLRSYTLGLNVKF
ncbi:TonB-dependent receptor [Draconibacterium orientale]|uniref:TonB-dependent receptor n=1 Tax=Draconibacterium orientale TaxID=1168034 RepID=UPI002ABE9817|nr:TonB-dependent receptor [Draconibacterium orientale]